MDIIAFPVTMYIIEQWIYSERYYPVDSMVKEE